MQILSHRGLWQAPWERNTLAAFIRSFDAGYGSELDVRDRLGALVVSHDPPLGDALALPDVLREYAAAGEPSALAINVKADGLATSIRDACAKCGVSSYFCFDQSIPDLIAYIDSGMPTFTRHSDVETQPVLYDRTSGIWLDAFYDDAWFNESDLIAALNDDKRVCIVSPELHGRPPAAAWKRWASWDTSSSDRVFACTDRPLALAEVLL